MLRSLRGNLFIGILVLMLISTCLTVATGCDSSHKEAKQFWDKGMDAWAENSDRIAAIEHFDRAIELDPKYVLAYYSRAGVYAGLGKEARIQESDEGKALGYYEKAIDDAKKAASLEPENILYLANLGQLQARGRDYEAAKATFRSILRIDPSNKDAKAGIKILKNIENPESRDKYLPLVQ